jgi:type VI secretion system secreted protein VgrG
MSTITQANYPLKISTDLGDDVLILTGFSGVEGISMPFSFTVQLMSTDPGIEPADLLHTPAVLTLALAGGEERRIHGIFARFIQTGRQETERNTQVFYEGELIPSLGFLALSRDSRIFQNKTALEIVEEVLEEAQVEFRSLCTQSFPPREYCVQYRETHLGFVSRLMEEEGIFYFFEQTGSGHMLVLADDTSSIEPCPTGSAIRYGGQISREDLVTSLQGAGSVFSGKVTLKDYDPLQPSLTLEAVLEGEGEGEVFEYPGGFDTLEGGERIVRLQLEAEEALRRTVRGEGTIRTLQAGYRFDLDGHFNPDLNQTYTLLQVEQTAEMAGTEFEMTARFLAIPYDIPYRRLRQTPKPVMRGPQTAVVVGPSGEEIWVDSYGRVKVQFHWDRRGENDENSSCWIRVASSWAGKGWGAIRIPRIGQEVLVDFLDGDPDRPIVVGSVYNAEQMPPYELPDHQTQSGVKSRSSKEATAENFNEIRFEDLKGEEQIYLHAEKDLDAVIENNETRKVGFEKKDKGDQTVEVFNNQTITVGAGEGDADDGSQALVVYKDRAVTLKTGDETKTIQQGNQTITIEQGNQTITIKQGNRSVTLDQGNDGLTIKTGNLTTKLQQGNATLELDMGNATTKASLGKISEEAMQAIEMKVGQSSIKIDQTGVTIKGMMVKVEGQVQTQIKGMMTEVTADAILQVKGSLTMIN